jgi:hypothetical protein
MKKLRKLAVDCLCVLQWKLASSRNASTTVNHRSSNEARKGRSTRMVIHAGGSRNAFPSDCYGAESIDPHSCECPLSSRNEARPRLVPRAGLEFRAARRSQSARGLANRRQSGGPVSPSFAPQCARGTTCKSSTPHLAPGSMSTNKYRRH